MTNSSGSGSRLDPALKERLLKESRNPLRGLRRVLWIALFGSASIGLIIMCLRAISGASVVLNDAYIQVCAVLLFGTLLWFDRSGQN